MKRLSLALALLIGGCVVPMQFNAPDPYGLIDEAVLKSLVGSSLQEVRGQLGEPSRALTGSSETYFLYQGRDYPGTTLIIDRVWHEEWRVQLHCYLLVFDQTKKVVRYKSEIGFEQLGKYTNTEQFGRRISAPKGPKRDCTDFVWTKGKFVDLLRAMAAQGDTEAAIELAVRFEDRGPLKTLAGQGNTEAAFELARRFKDPGPLRVIAEQGDMEAAIDLAEMFKEVDPLKKIAERGNITALYELSQVSRPGSGEEWKWLCRAAKQGHLVAQAKIAGYFESGEGQEPKDLVKAYTWIRAAEKNGFESNDQGTYKVAGGGWACCRPRVSQERIAEQLTPEQQAQVAELDLDGEPGDC